MRYWRRWRDAHNEITCPSQVLLVPSHSPRRPSFLFLLRCCATLMAQDARLIKTIRNVVLVWVKRANLNPVEFEWKEVKGQDRTRTGYSNDFLMSILTHKPTKFYYRSGPFTDKYSPGSETQTDSRDHSGSWDQRFSLIEDWLRFLKKEYEAPDSTSLSPLR